MYGWVIDRFGITGSCSQFKPAATDQDQSLCKACQIEQDIASSPESRQKPMGFIKNSG
jgi:hypothetical protein